MTELKLEPAFARPAAWTEKQAWAAGKAAFKIVRDLDRRNGHLSGSFRDYDAHTAGEAILQAVVDATGVEK